MGRGFRDRWEYACRSQIGPEACSRRTAGGEEAFSWEICLGNADEAVFGADVDLAATGGESGDVERRESRGYRGPSAGRDGVDQHPVAEGSGVDVGGGCVKGVGVDD